MTAAQYDALQEIFTNGDKFKAYELNIAKRTVASTAKKGWIDVDAKGFAFVTDKGVAAIEAL